MRELKKYLIRRKERAQKKVDSIKEIHGDNPASKFNYFGGQNLGYWEGRASAFEDILDELEGDSQ